MVEAHTVMHTCFIGRMDRVGIFFASLALFAKAIQYLAMSGVGDLMNGSGMRTSQHVYMYEYLQQCVAVFSLVGARFFRSGNGTKHGTTSSACSCMTWAVATQHETVWMQDSPL